jgi:predicted Fe-Mo cluster-binding NifX family protein
MKTTPIVPVSDNDGLNAGLAEHFGRAPFYAVAALDEERKVENIKMLENKGGHFLGGGDVHDEILELRPNPIRACGMGPRGLSGFQEAKVAVLKAKTDTVKEVIAAYNDGTLQELTEGRFHARHHLGLARGRSEP